MAKLVPALFLTVFFAVALSLVACGGGSGSSRQLLSVIVTPAAAIASDFPNGMVQFTATDTYDRSPSPATVNPANWGLVPSVTYPMDAVSFSPGGVAQCKTGFTGTVTVQGGGFWCPSNPKMGIPCHLVSGIAQLTCP